MATITLFDTNNDAGSTGARAGAQGFLTDVTLCIGCKACEVACKQWNELPSDNVGWTGNSYDNTGDLGATTWRHVAFVEQISDGSGQRPAVLQPFQSNWLMLSDVCKHCVNAPCMEACPTGAIVRTEFDSVYIQQEICNGCGYCVPACPFGVPELHHTTGTVGKCTFCYDRQKEGLQPACATTCPTASIQFGPVDELLERGKRRVAELQAQGVAGASLYGDRASGGTDGLEGLNALFVLTAPPHVYNLPAQPELPQRHLGRALLSTLGAALAVGAAAFVTLRGQ